MNKNSPLLLVQDRLAALSLRTKLILANVIITLLALAGMGYYVYFRAQDASSYLTRQLDQNIRQQAQDTLRSTSTERAAQLDAFFATMRDKTATLGATTANLLAHESTLNNGYYWDASRSLTRLPQSGSWDNPASDPGSVFIPARIDLSPSLQSELNTIQQLDFYAPSTLKANLDITAIYFGGLSGETLYYPNIDLAAIVPPDFDVTQRPWFIKANPAQNPQLGPVWSDPYLDAALHGLVITSSIPVLDASGRFRGVAAMDIQLNKITEIVSNIKVGQTGYAFLLDKDKRLIAMPQSGYADFGIPAASLPLGETLDPAKIPSQFPPEFWDLLSSMASGKTGFATLTFQGSERFIVYQPIPSVGYGLAIIVPSSELLAGSVAAQQQVAQVTRSTITVSLLLVAAILVLAVLATLSIGNGLTRPLRALTLTAQEFANGNLDAEASAGSQDEIGTLARTLNSMSATIRRSFQTLESRIQDRTVDLERRAVQMRAAAEVGNAAASIRNLGTLLDQATRLISLRFGFYHTGIFLLDEAGKFAVLRSASSEGGQRMLLRGHRLQVGLEGIVGNVAQSGRPRIAQDTGRDAVFFDNPDLPETHSEIAVPIIASGQTLGVLDVQSTSSAAFTEEDASTLQIVADQLAIAIENARLLEESQSATESTRRAFGEIAVQFWRRRLEDATFGYRGLERGSLVPLTQAEHGPEARSAIQEGKPVLARDGTTLHVPILIRNQAIGVLRLTKPNHAAWTENEIQTVQTLSDQLSGALDGARLYEEAQKRAQREIAVAQVSARISRAVEVDDILRATAEELGKMMGDSEVVIQLAEETP